MRFVLCKALVLLVSLVASFQTFAAVLEGGVVAAPDEYGAEVAAQVLKRGGNAVDAVVAENSNRKQKRGLAAPFFKLA